MPSVSNIALKISDLAFGYSKKPLLEIDELQIQKGEHLAVIVETPAGQSVLGATPKFTIEGTTRMLVPGEISPEMSTDESGILEFEIIGGAKGLNQLTVSYGNNSATLLLNILSSDIKGFSPLPTLEGGLNWAALMEAELEYAEDHVQGHISSSHRATSRKTGETDGVHAAARRRY